MALAPGTRLGPYAITTSIGAGGMGEVYKATDTRLGRTVAVKVLPEHVAADLELKQRFEREAKTLAALSHPHICPVFDVGSQDATQFLVMEYLEGETLEQRLKKGALPLDQASQLGIQIADALAAAHRAGIIHRDLKPGNVMLTGMGAARHSPQAKLLDFGLAKASAPAVASNLSMLPTTPPGLTQHGTILGTLHYMAPEQVEGKEADARSDIFALGGILYEMATGKKAFDDKSTASVLAAILEREPPSMSVVQPLVPSALDRVVKNYLAKEPERRWQSASDLTDELKWIAESGVSATMPSGGAPRALSRRRMAWLVGVAMLAAVAIAGAAAPIEGRGAVWSAGTPMKLLEPRYFGTGSNPGRTYDISPDDQRFLMIKQGSNDQAAPPQIVVIQNWLEELKRLVPAN
jgi:eukaryotic-like serine/threonine-protein kinase